MGGSEASYVKPEEDEDDFGSCCEDEDELKEREEFGKVDSNSNLDEYSVKMNFACPGDSGSKDNCCLTPLVDEDGTFNVAGIDNFATEVKLAGRGLSYAVVAIMGPQSSGKSTFLNQLFGTNFREMDALRGRSKTTQGIWLAHSVGIEPCTLVMDLEGTDGRERGEDDTTFEKQSSLFALAASDILLINMWCHEIGREQAANKPLLRTVFQFMMRLFSPRKTTLMFVIRDKSPTPVEKLEQDLREDIQKIWKSILKPQAHKESPLSEFFNVEVVALSSYQYEKEQFTEEVECLRHRFFHSIAPGGLAGDRRTVVPGSGFSFSAQKIWKAIKENKDLDLPAHKVMVATVRCEEIANEKLLSFMLNEEWRQLEVRVQSQLVPGFGKKLTSILNVCLSEYDAETIYFDESIRSSKWKQLEEKLLQVVQPAYNFMLGHICSVTMDRFKESFDSALNKGMRFAVAVCSCTENSLSRFEVASADARIGQGNWETYDVGKKLRGDINAHVAAIRAAKLSELTAMYENKLNEALAAHVEALLVAAKDDIWPAIRNFFHREAETAVSEFSSALSGFEIDDVAKNKMLLSLEDYARGVVEAKAKEAAKMVLALMKNRFAILFYYDSNLMPNLMLRVWTKKEDVQEVANTARSACLKLLSIMAAVRLDDKADSIEKTLFRAFIEPISEAASSNTTSVDPLAKIRWDEVPPSKTLLTPFECKNLWEQFITESQHIVSQATAEVEEESRRRTEKWLKVLEIGAGIVLPIVSAVVFKIPVRRFW